MSIGNLVMAVKGTLRLTVLWGAGWAWGGWCWRARGEMERGFNQASDGGEEDAVFASLEALGSERCSFYQLGPW